MTAVIPTAIRFYPDTFEPTLLEHFAHVPIGTQELSSPYRQLLVAIEKRSDEQGAAMLYTLMREHLPDLHRYLDFVTYGWRANRFSAPLWTYIRTHGFSETSGRTSDPRHVRNIAKLLEIPEALWPELEVVGVCWH
jgi:hypothetical protein